MLFKPRQTLAALSLLMLANLATADLPDSFQKLAEGPFLELSTPTPTEDCDTTPIPPINGLDSATCVCTYKNPGIPTGGTYVTVTVVLVDSNGNPTATITGTGMAINAIATGVNVGGTVMVTWTDSNGNPTGTGVGIVGPGIAATGVAGTGVAGTGVAGTGVVATGVAGTGVAGTGVADTGVTGVATTADSNADTAETGIAAIDTGVAATDTGVAATDTGVAATDTGVAATGIATGTGVVATGTGVVATGTGVVATATGTAAATATATAPATASGLNSTANATSTALVTAPGLNSTATAINSTFTAPNFVAILPKDYGLVTVPTPVSNVSSEYANLLNHSMWFYAAQQSGHLINKRVSWRNDSCLTDGADHNIDLSGGYYATGSYMKYTFTLSYSLNMLSWGAVEYLDGYILANQVDYLRETVKWGTDWIIKAHPNPETLYVQVGNYTIDHNYWGPDDSVPLPRPSFAINSTRPGTDVAAEAAAAMASASLLFSTLGKNQTNANDTAYATVLLKHAEDLWNFAVNAKPYTLYQYQNQTLDTALSGSFLSTGYTDELFWSSVHLYRATKNTTYLDAARTFCSSFNLTSSKRAVSWDWKVGAAYVLIAEVTSGDVVTGLPATSDAAYWQGLAEQYLDSVTNITADGAYLTKGGLLWFNGTSESNSISTAMTQSMLLFIYSSSVLRRISGSSQQGPEAIRAARYETFAQAQLDYVFGRNPMSTLYIVGEEQNSPQNPHHAGASGGFNASNLEIPKNTEYVLYGAVVAGPDSSDGYTDDRADISESEVALIFNAPLQSVIARQALYSPSNPFYINAANSDSSSSTSGLPTWALALIIVIALLILVLLLLCCYLNRAVIAAFFDRDNEDQDTQGIANEAAANMNMASTTTVGSTTDVPVFGVGMHREMTEIGLPEEFVVEEMVLEDGAAPEQTQIVMDETEVGEKFETEMIMIETDDTSVTVLGNQPSSSFGAAQTRSRSGTALVGGAVAGAAAGAAASESRSVGSVSRTSTAVGGALVGGALVGSAGETRSTITQTSTSVVDDLVGGAAETRSTITRTSTSVSSDLVDGAAETRSTITRTSTSVGGALVGGEPRSTISRTSTAVGSVLGGGATETRSRTSTGFGSALTGSAGETRSTISRTSTLIGGGETDTVTTTTTTTKTITKSDSPPVSLMKSNTFTNTRSESFTNRQS